MIGDRKTEETVRIRPPAIDPTSFQKGTRSILVTLQLNHPGAAPCRATISPHPIAIIARFIAIDLAIAAHRPFAGIVARICIVLVTIVAGFVACLPFGQVAPEDSVAATGMGAVA